MFSKKLSSKLEELGIEIPASWFYIRTELEELLDERAEYVNTHRHHEYQAVEKVYSLFMVEYTEFLDMEEGMTH